MKILLISDSPNWIFARHCKEISTRITKYQFDICHKYIQDPQSFNYDNYDAIYFLDCYSKGIIYPEKDKVILGLRNQFMYNKNNLEKFFNKAIKNKCKIFHVVNKNQYNDFKNLCVQNNIKILLVQHGVDIDIFKQDNVDYKELIVGFSGSAEKKQKGVDIIEQVCNKNNIKFISSGKKLTKEQMPSFYKNINTYVCMSESEGLNNSILEAGAMKKCIVSTNCGAAEQIINSNNGFIIERDVKSLENILIYLKNNINIISILGNEIYKEIFNNWSWNTKIKEYESMFDQFFIKSF